MLGPGLFGLGLRYTKVFEAIRVDVGGGGAAWRRFVGDCHDFIWGLGH